MPIFLTTFLSGVAGAWAGWKGHAAVATPPASLPSGDNPASTINLTTIAGYAIVGGLVLYFGNRALSK